MKNKGKKIVWAIGGFFFFFLPIRVTAFTLPDRTPGCLAGLVVDKQTREPLTGATVQIEGNAAGAVTDIDGRFLFPELMPGSYKIEVKYISYALLQLGPVVISPGEKTLLTVEMTEASLSLEGVVVVARAKQNTELALLKATQASLVVQSGISAQQIGRTQDRDASEVIRRIPGISLIDGKFVMVRGLSQRYNNVWINNSAVPSSEADSRAFSFDIIPSGQMDNLIVVKSPAPEFPADFSGGFIKINTKDIPERDAFSVSIGGSWNDQTHFRNFLYNPGSPTDFLGFDNGCRRLPGSYTLRQDNADQAAVNEITRRGFNTNWQIKNKHPWGDLRLNTSLNHTFRRDDGKRLALLAAVNYTNAYKRIENMENARYSLYDVNKDTPDYKNQYTDQVYSNDVRIGAMANLTYLPDGDTKYEFKNIFNQLGQNRYTRRDGFLFNSGKYIQEKQEYFYASRTAYNGQFTGTRAHEEATFDWSVGYAYANKNQPDRRMINREENGFAGDPHEGEMRIDQNEIQRLFYRLDEHIVSAAVNYQWKFRFGSLRPLLKAGVYGEYRHRNYQTRAFYYRWNPEEMPGGFEYEEVVSSILQPGNLGADKLYAYEDTDNRNSYKGMNLSGAGYIGLNVPVDRFDFYGGVRYEYTKMQLTSYVTLKDFKTQKTRYPSSRFFPSLNASYRFDEAHQLRLAYGLSINRPEFRERSGSVYYDFDLFSNVMGNPGLKPAYIQNADMRYEFYPGANETVSVALFYKHFKNPIEWTYIDNGGSYTYTYENARSATNYGIEVDIQKNLAFLGLEHFSWNFNGAYIRSHVHFDTDRFEKSRPMQGQSPYLINTGIFYQYDPWGLFAGVLYNRIGKRITEVGKADATGQASINNDFPDTYELARNTIDLSFGKKLGTHWEVKANVRNLLGEKIKFVQYPKFYDSDHVLQKREQVTKQYTSGRNFFLSLSYRL